MRTVVIYKSRTGNARKYAEMIASHLGADLFNSGQIHVERLFSYDTIIFGGGLYVRGIYGLRNLVNNLDLLKDKNIIVYATGATHPKSQDVNSVMRSNFTEEQLKHMKFFYLHSEVNYEMLSFGDKLMISIIKFRLKNKKNRTKEQDGLLEAYAGKHTHDKTECIKPVLDYVSSLQK